MIGYIYFSLGIESSNSGEKGVDEEVALADDVQVLYYLEGVYHNGAGGAIEHRLLLSENVVLDADSVRSQKQSGSFAVDHGLKAMQPIVVGGNNIVVS